MKTVCIAALLCAQTFLAAEAVGAKMELANPVRKIVNVMTKMQAQIEAEGDEKESMFNKFMCYCKGGGNSLSASISAAENKVPQLESSIKEHSGAKAQLKADVTKATSDREESAAAAAKAKAIREKEESDFSAEAAESKANIAALGRAIPAIEQGMGASFLQANLGLTDKLRQLSVSMDMEAVDRDLLASFLQDGSSARGSGEILGILKQMQEEMTKDLADASASEEASARGYEGLVSATKKERAALTKAIETKTVRVGELSVGTAELKNDQEDTQEALAEDKNMYANLDKNCATKEKEYEEYKKSQSAELVALADTIKLLNDDDANELFRKTLPSSASSFMQVQFTTSALQRRASKVLRSTRRARRHGGDPRLDFLELALHGGQMGFDKIIKMVDDLMAVLRKEQRSDDSKKAYCTSEIDKQEDTQKGLTGDISDVAKSIADGEGDMKSLAKEIADLGAGITELDSSVAKATAARKQENSDYVKTMAEGTATKELLEMAKNRLNKFYQPGLYKEAPQRELSEEERATLAAGGTLAPTAAPGGIAGTGISAASFVQVQAHRAGAAYRAADMSFSTKKEEGTGVVALINLLISDMEKSNQEAELEEKEGQAEYETFMGDAKSKRSLDAKTITDKEGAKAMAEAALGADTQTSKDKKTELMETGKLIMGLHGECDFLLKFYDTRKQARTDELESLDKSKAVLSGADYSFVQIASTRLRR